MKKKKTHTLGPYPATVELIVDMERGRSRIHRITSQFRFAYELRSAARVMAHKARAVADEDGFELRAFVIAAVILAWSSLDAALNEFILLNATEPKSPLNDVEKAIINAIRAENLRPHERQRTLQLFNTMLRLLKKSPLAESEQPYQSANLATC